MSNQLLIRLPPPHAQATESPVAQLRASITAGLRAYDLVPAMIYFLAQRRKALAPTSVTSSTSSPLMINALFKHSLYQVFLYIISRFAFIEGGAGEDDVAAGKKNKSGGDRKKKQQPHEDHQASGMMGGTMRGRRTVVGACRGAYHISCPSGTSDSVKADFDQVSDGQRPITFQFKSWPRFNLAPLVLVSYNRSFTKGGWISWLPPMKKQMENPLQGTLWSF